MDLDVPTQCPFSQWSTYFSLLWEEMGNENAQKVIYAVNLFDQSFQTPSFLRYDLSLSSSVRVDYGQFSALISDPLLLNFAENEPELFLPSLALVCHSYLLPTEENPQPRLPYSSSLPVNLEGPSSYEWPSSYPERIFVRLFNFPSSIELRDIKSSSTDKLRSVRGTVVRVSNTKPVLQSIGVECMRCHSIWTLHCRDGTPGHPRRCIQSSCSSTNFSLLREMAVTMDWQKIRLQEICEVSSQGRIPVTRDIEVTGDEVDRCVPGDIITVVGIIRVFSVSETRGKGNRGVGRGGVAIRSKTSKKAGQDGSAPTSTSKNQAPLYEAFIEANSIQNTKATSENSKDASTANSKNLNSADSLSSDYANFSVTEMYGVLQIANHPSPFALICASLCPTIYGHHLVKAGLVLALFGGRQKLIDGRTSVSLRSDIHVLIVGDPGLGKSQLLTSVSNISPRGIYVCGSYASASGLTVSIHKEAGTHDYALEAGALVLANNGIACIDELDKMSSELDALLEAMEQQQISVAKAGIVCNLPARASIIAAANPRKGHYDKSKTIAENLNMSSALLSRFDLIFVLLDKADAQQDDLISDHIISQHGMHASEKGQTSTMFKEFVVNPPNGSELPLPTQAPRPPPHKIIPSSQINGTPFMAPLSLLERLQSYNPSEEEGLLPSSLLNRYISYAKKYVEPKLTPAAKLVLQDFYLSLRRSQQSQDGTPVTTRQLESLIRLAEARAKVEMRTEVTESDARDVIEIMKSSLRDALDGFEAVDLGATGKRGKGKIAQRFISGLHKKARDSGKYEYTKQELYAFAKDMQIVPSSSFDEFIDSLNHQGYLLRSKGHTWKVFGT